MPDHERVLQVVGEWIVKAEGDLKTAAHTLKMGRDCPTDIVCFHAQQCVEKYLKAMLVLHHVDFPKTHDVEKLVTLLPHDMLADWATAEQRRLTQYATITRYPGDYAPISLSEARGAVRIARRIRKKLRLVLPKEVLRARRR